MLPLSTLTFIGYNTLLKAQVGYHFKLALLFSPIFVIFSLHIYTAIFMPKNNAFIFNTLTSMCSFSNDY